jgi:hypothetical protein
MGSSELYVQETGVVTIQKESISTESEDNLLMEKWRDDVKKKVENLRSK